jgi:hypothetical protein
MADYIEGTESKKNSRRHRVSVGKPWDGPMAVEVLQAGIAARLVAVVIALLCLVAVATGLIGEPKLASDALALVRDLALITVGALLRPRGG